MTRQFQRKATNTTEQPAGGNELRRRSRNEHSRAHFVDHPADTFMNPHFGHHFSYLRVHSDRGRALPAEARDEAEARLGRPLDHVRLHDDTEAGWTALSLAARAVTIGNHIYVAPGQLDVTGPRLLLHELAHVASQDPALGTQTQPAPESHPAEQFARDFAAGKTAAPPRSPVGVYRDPMRREDFDLQLRQKFAVTRIFTGTFADQVARLNFFGRGQRPGDSLDQAGWTAWDPGADSEVYDWILAAFVSLARSFGGVPSVQDLSFYETDFKPDDHGVLVPDHDVLAEYGGGHMAIYHSAVTRATMNVRPTGRSTGATAAPLEALTAEAGVKDTVVHELGHGIVETALTSHPPANAPDPAFMSDYRREVGWTTGEPAQLYDIGVEEVRTALAAGNTPPAQYRITEDNWNSTRWSEQPLTSYMATHPSEDLPEALANFVSRPDLLRARSPHRFAFLDARRVMLTPFLTRDLSNVRLQLTDEQMQNLIGGPVPAWQQPVPPPVAPATKTPAVRFQEGPTLEVRF